MKKHFIFIVILFLVAFVSFYYFAAYPLGKRHHKSRLQQGKEERLKLSGKLENGIRVIEVKASRYKFEPDPMVVRLGEKVRLVVTSMDATHGLVISEFKINLSIPAGQTRSVEFIADKKGAFHAHCNVYCGEGHGQMHARLIVK